MLDHSQFLITTLQQRREKLAQLIDIPVILWSGKHLSRNFPANQYPFRASSHFLYFAGLSLANTAIRLENGNLELFMDNPPADAALWQGEMPTREEIGSIIGAKGCYPLEKLSSRALGAATVGVQDTFTWQHQSRVLNRPVSPSSQPQGIDLKLAQALVYLRLTHDAGALQELRQAAKVAVKAHQTGIRVTCQAKTEAEVRGGDGGSDYGP